jgi:hypothetical protein
VTLVARLWFVFWVVPAAIGTILALLYWFRWVR